MYAVENIKKFVKDNSARLGPAAVQIITRAEEIAEGDLLPGSAVEEIFLDIGLSNEFHGAVAGDPEHQRIGLAALLGLNQGSNS